MDHLEQNVNFSLEKCLCYVHECGLTDRNLSFVPDAIQISARLYDNMAYHFL